MKVLSYLTSVTIIALLAASFVFSANSAHSIVRGISPLDLNLLLFGCVQGASVAFLMCVIVRTFLNKYSFRLLALAWTVVSLMAWINIETRFWPQAWRISAFPMPRIVFEAMIGISCGFSILLAVVSIVFGRADNRNALLAAASIVMLNLAHVGFVRMGRYVQISYLESESIGNSYKKRGTMDVDIKFPCRHRLDRVDIDFATESLPEALSVIIQPGTPGQEHFLAHPRGKQVSILLQGEVMQDFSLQMGNLGSPPKISAIRAYEKCPNFEFDAGHCFYSCEATVCMKYAL